MAAKRPQSQHHGAHTQRQVGLYPLYRSFLDPAAAELDDVAVGVADEDGDVAVAEGDGPLGDGDALRVERRDGVGDRGDLEGHMGVARVFLRHVHEDVALGVAGIGVVDQVDLDIGSVGDDGDGVEIDLVAKLEAEHAVEDERALEIAHADADVIDALDGDRGAAHARFSGLLLKDRVGTSRKSDMCVWTAIQSWSGRARSKATVARPGRS